MNKVESKYEIMAREYLEEEENKLEDKEYQEFLDRVEKYELENGIEVVIK